MSFHIQPITQLEPDLCESLSQLLIDVVEDGASIGFLPPLRYEEALAYWNDVLSPSVLLWVAYLQEEPVGTIQLHLCERSNGSHRAEIAKLMVHPTARRRGIAQALMSTAEENARIEGRSTLVLDTRAGDPSNTLYLSFGYVEAGRIPQYARSADGNLHDTVFYYKLL
ncbi:N-acetyltransferase family protein [Brevibacillus ginsengisoli]|uniref:GNAT family N-acetyltransferase n=1 Tax=Brevibacillus ginsengisoli TaxID=363854 RepID=UPI003CE885C8